MKKILLIRPSSSRLPSLLDKIVVVEPLELEYLSAVASECGYECKIHDSMIDKTSLSEVLSAYKPDIVGITGYVTHVDLMKKYAKIAKSISLATKVVMGGVHAEINYELFYDESVDFIIHSGGMQTFRVLLQTLPQEKTLLADIPGLCYKSNAKQWIANEAAFIDVAQIPLPDRSFFYNNIQKYKYGKYSPCAIVKASYCCPHKCNFCYCTQLNGGNYVTRPVKDTVKEIAGIDCEYIWIVDDTFYVNHSDVKEFIALVKKENINKKFIVYYRADFIVNNEELIIELAEVGLFLVLVGLESFSNKQLESYEKGVKAATNMECLEVLKRNKIGCCGLFMVDNTATIEDFKRLNHSLKALEMKLATIAILTPIPGTKQYEDSKDQLTTDDPTKWDFLHLVNEPTNMSRVRFYYEFYKLYLTIVANNTTSNLLGISLLQLLSALANVFSSTFTNLFKEKKLNV